MLPVFNFYTFYLISFLYCWIVSSDYFLQKSWWWVSFWNTVCLFKTYFLLRVNKFPGWKIPGLISDFLIFWKHFFPCHLKSSVTEISNAIYLLAASNLESAYHLNSLLCLEFHMCGIMRYIMFCIWLLSFNIMIFRLTIFLYVSVEFVPLTFLAVYQLIDVWISPVDC